MVVAISGSSRLLCSILQRGSGQSTFASTSSRPFSSSSIIQRNLPSRRPRDPLARAPNATRHQLPSGETLIIRPPPSAEPPQNLAIAADQPITMRTAVSTSPPPALKPTTRHGGGTLATLSAGDIERIQLLRRDNPLEQSLSKLAKQFQVSPQFISMVAPLSKGIRQMKAEPIETARKNWGANKTLHRLLRAERKSLW